MSFEYEISVIVVSFNTRDMTLACLDSIYKTTNSTNFEVLVWDNNSGDGSAASIAKSFPEVNLFCSEENLGFAQANNAAIEMAKGEYVLLLNPDTVVLDNAIDSLFTFAKNNRDAKIWGGKTLFGDLTLNANSCFAKMSVWNQLCRATGLASIFRSSNIFNAEEYGGWKRDSIKRVDIVCGCYLLISHTLWKNLGGFDKRFFMYGEEADLCLRAAKYGASPMITPHSQIIHYGGGSEKVRADKMVRLLSAKSELIKVHWSKVFQPVGRSLLKTWVVTRVIAHKIIFYIGSGDKERARENYHSWHEILKRSKEWYFGYTN